jgi:hypothetical protein
MATLEGRNDREGTVTNSGGVITAQDFYLLTMDAPSNHQQAFNMLQLLGDQPSTPVNVGNFHPDIKGLRVVSQGVDHKSGDDTTLFNVTINYSNSLALSQQGNSEDPLDVPTKYTYDQVDELLAVELDPITGKRIVNSAGRPFSAITENFPLTRIIIERNEKTFNNDDAGFYRNTMNDGPVTINGDNFLHNTVKIERITGSPQTDSSGVVYYKVIYSVLIKDSDWRRLVIDRGTVDKDGKPPARNVRLDSEGAGLLDGAGNFQTADYDDEVVEEILFSTLREENYGPLRL